MALKEFKNLPDTSTPINAENLNHNFNELNKFGDVKLKSKEFSTSAIIKSENGYGIVLVISSQYIALVQLAGNNETPYIKDIYGTHAFTANVSGNNVTLDDLYNWDHYIFIGSNVITEIE